MNHFCNYSETFKSTIKDSIPYELLPANLNYRRLHMMFEQEAVRVTYRITFKEKAVLSTVKYPHPYPKKFS